MRESLKERSPRLNPLMAVTMIAGKFSKGHRELSHPLKDGTFNESNIKLFKRLTVCGSRDEPNKMPKPKQMT